MTTAVRPAINWSKALWINTSVTVSTLKVDHHPFDQCEEQQRANGLPQQLQVAAVNTPINCPANQLGHYNVAEVDEDHQAVNSNFQFPIRP